ncbi:MAG: HD domain-containing protein [Lachnospiraceae bacterium]|nr:HD domain-containing protein [Lachnospiraceae bacterium]
MLEKKKERRQLVLPFLICIIGLVLNIGGRLMTSTMDIPIYFDTGGTILVAVLGGIVPGIAVALITNVLIYFTNPVSIFYGSLNVMIAIATAFAYRYNWQKNVKKSILYLLILVAIGGGIGGFLTLYLSGVQVDSGNQAIITFFENMGMSKTVAWYISNLVFEIFDKFFTVLFVGILLQLFPKQIWKKFRFMLWMQEPLSEEEIDDIYAQNNRGLSLNRKFYTVLIVFALTTASICTTVCLVLFKNYSIEQHTYLAEGVAKLAASVIDGDSVDTYLSEGDDFDSYRETSQLLYDMQKNTPDVEFVYVYKIMSDGCHVVFDVETDGVKADRLGDVIAFDSTFMEYLPDLLNGKRIEPMISDDSYGWLLTAYEPVYDSSGECVCYAAVDIAMEELTNYQIDFMLKTICVFISFLLFIFAVVMWFAKYHVIIPINAITNVADQFGYQDEFTRKQNVKKLSRLDIQTGDEIERLYRAFLKSTEESTRFFEESKKRQEKMTKMQSSLIMVLADMVESRDEETGDHVRKTAAYVGIIGYKMKELGYYKEQMTEGFIENCIRSAPLHDIGKIAIPDAILNKPGKLTEDEFEIMKTHAEEGRLVIEKAIATMPDADYLEEAKNLAGGHHEKWNGSGYPKGLAGEDIPLSARIMAVADVFDALVSERCYKPPFTYEKAFSIIEEDAGSHFDPLVADAFLKAKDEVIEVADDFGNQSDTL